MSHAPGSVNPATLKPLSPIQNSTVAEVKAAVATARAMQPVWAALSLDERAAKMKALGQAILAKADALAQTMSDETGRSTIESKGSELTSLAPYVETAIAE